MSKQSEAKLRQRYVEKLTNTCGRCKCFRSTVETKSGYFGSYKKESNLRCMRGGFAVKKSGSCAEWIGNGVS